MLNSSERKAGKMTCNMWKEFIKVKKCGYRQIFLEYLPKVLNNLESNRIMVFTVNIILKGCYYA